MAFGAGGGIGAGGGVGAGGGAGGTGCFTGGLGSWAFILFLILILLVFGLGFFFI